jgi:NAD(P)H dehydrogenase (quinone)
MTSIVVTGATGHLGRLIIEGLLRNGVAPSDIVAGGRKVEKLDDLARRGVVVRTIDYDDPATLASAFAGADTLMLVSASEPGHRVPQHKAAIDAAVAAGITRIVYTSAPDARASALVLAPEHKATEELIEGSGIPTTILRNGWYTENFVGAANEARETGIVAASVGDGRIASASRVDYADAAAAVLVSNDHIGAVYELSGDVAWDYDELAAAISAAIGRDVAYARLTPEDHRAALLAAGLDEGTAGFVTALDGNTRDGLLAGGSGDLARLIGRPTTPLAEGLAAALG